uniref:DUF7869 domain-containing protein n=1 Tax=Magallana gigas TaxID=29159 RepID=A0A8W8MH47_MAGGI
MATQPTVELKLWVDLSALRIHEGSFVEITCVIVDLYQNRRSLNSSASTKDCQFKNIDVEDEFSGVIDGVSFDDLERQKYYKHQQKAKSYPNRYLSLFIIDGMDQSKTQLPHFVHAIKFTSAMWRLRVRLVGVIVHGIGVYAFFDLFEYSHSTNLTLSVLLSVIYMSRESPPDVLYLQMDNCARENKNRE